ncbi:MAG: recombinase [Nanoarchaeota archaeon]
MEGKLGGLVSVKELANYTLVSRYSGFLPEEKRRETWNETVKRMMDMHRTKYPDYPEEEMQEIQDALQKKLCLGSQRALQFGGKGVLVKNARQYNCTFSYCDRLKFFQECFWLLLCGCGTGFSVQKHHVEKLPKFLRERKNKNLLFVPGDTIESWADCLGVLLSSYFEGEVPAPEYQGYDVVFDFSLIRPKGALLSTSNGKAPGPEPLKNALEKIRKLLDKCREEREKLRPIDAYDIVMHASDAVLAGGIRRSATIALFSPDDDEMKNAKTGNWFVENAQRGRSNNSALIVRNKITRKQFHSLMESIKEFGEPGFYFVDDEELGTNPCGEVNFFSYAEIDGQLKSGFHFCNLSEINGKKCKTLEDFLCAAKIATRLGTLQAGYTKLDYLEKVSQKIVEKEALIGVSITGMMDNPDVLLSEENQKIVVKEIKKENERVAKLIGINPSARLTVIKPSGTASCLLGTASGIHPHHATRYLRKVQSNKLEAPFQYFKEINPLAVEDSVWDCNNNTGVISFCVEVEPGGKLKNQLSAIELLEYVKSTQKNWINTGTVRERCNHPTVVNSVSNTINVKPEEWDAVEEYIFNNRKHFAGISLLPITGDKDYPQAPFTAVYSPKEIINHYGDGALFCSGLIESALFNWGGIESPSYALWWACDTVLGLREADGNNQIRWIKIFKRFADRYFKSDYRKATYLLKDIYNWKLWMDLKREYKSVDYSLMIEEENTIDHKLEPSCAGGQCLT